MSAETDPSKVVCVGEGLHFGYYKHPIHATVDTRKAGPGELAVFCNGPESKAFCDLTDHADGTFTLTVRPQDVGRHQLYVQYNNQDVPGSPFNLLVSPASLIEVRGPGITNGVIRKGNSYEIQIDTSAAGPGSLKIRVGGPSGQFRVQTKKDGHVLRCRYNPQVPGVYVVVIKWNDHSVPGSPFRVFLAKNKSQLDEYMRESRASHA